ncbi:MAG: hypothetical protein NTW87_12545 [Planctomycetota bacterium]|nr:hypothetical protein [Planctomycetota bacterium]
MPAFQYPPHATEVLPDHVGNRYRFPFKVRSASNPFKTYTISYDNAPKAGYWVCSCPACTFRGGQCKHLDAAGLLGRQFGRSPMPTMKAAEPERPVVMRKRRVAPRQAAPVSVPGFALSRRAVAEDRAAKKAMWKTFAEKADDPSQRRRVAVVCQRLDIAATVRHEPC